MNTRRAPTGRPLVATDLARDADINDKENVAQAKLLYKLLIKAIPRMRNDLTSVMYLIDLADGDIQLILLLIVDKKIEELDPKFGLGKSLTHIHDHIMGSLLEIGYLTEEDDSDYDTEPDSDEESLPYYMTKGTIADIFNNAGAVTESDDESEEATTEEYAGECTTEDSDFDANAKIAPDTEESHVSDIYERDPTSSDSTEISTVYTTTASDPGSDSVSDPASDPVSDMSLGQNPLDSDTGDNDTPITDNTVGSPMVVEPSNVVDPSIDDEISTLGLMFLLHDINKK
ncbi:hypothetical protein B484DRAFT_407958 [Ochromonadaceae sp. CCMP2298]|nr:hypothetical protein B484DRAFT_407958 [Ochromonadaceae sp. CCMP2298]